MRRTLFIILLLGCSLAIKSFTQGTFQVTFDGPPTVPVGNQGGAHSYNESGFVFSGINDNGFTRNGGGISGYPEDGSAYLQALLLEGLVFRAANNMPFGLVSVDLAEYSTVFQEPKTVQFIGYYADGSTVTTSFTTDGIIDGTGPLQDFQTFLFPYKEWSGLQRVEIPNFGWSLDNLVVSVPEPATCVLALCGVALFGLKRWPEKR